MSRGQSFTCPVANFICKYQWTSAIFDPWRALILTNICWTWACMHFHPQVVVQEIVSSVDRLDTWHEIAPTLMPEVITNIRSFYFIYKSTLEFNHISLVLVLVYKIRFGTLKVLIKWQSIKMKNALCKKWKKNIVWCLFLELQGIKRT